MFPLGTVLIPFARLPLHVFEQRYREMTQHCLAGDREFGVVLIERGSEVGGGDTRCIVGTIAHIVQAAELPDGRWALDTVGTRRVQVLRWLDEGQSYPVAEVEELDESAPNDVGITTKLQDSAEQILRKVLALETEAGVPSPAVTFELHPDPGIAVYQMMALGRFGPFDAQQLLEVSSSDERLMLMTTLLEERAQLLELGLAGH